MAKRIAEKELTDRNWDQEDEAEEVGTFSVASEEVLKNRAIKKAKRRNVGFEPDGGGAFKGFRGLVAPSGGGGFSGFGGGAGGKPLEGLSNGNGAAAASPFPGSRAAAEPKAAFGASGPKSSPAAAPASTNGGPQPGRAYHKQLAALNRSVRDWIVQHVDSNPLCDLTPIFQDYARYLAAIEQQHDAPPGAAPAPPAAPRPEPAFAFPGERAQAAPERPDGAAAAAGEKPDGPLGAAGAGPLAGFSFSAGGGLGLFGADAAQSKAAAPSPPKPAEPRAEGGASQARAGGEDDESEEPPAVVVTEVKEDDAFYSKKCKLFYRKDSEFREKGVGTLHLKPTASQRTQLLVRADTNLGNILLNVLVTPNMPCSRTGKNNVLLVCVPNPPVDERNAAAPVPMLIRVKTSEDADELHRLLLDKRDA